MYYNSGRNKIEYKQKNCIERNPSKKPVVLVKKFPVFSWNRNFIPAF